MIYPIDERLEQLHQTEGPAWSLPKSIEFADPLLLAFQGVRLSQVIDQELDRHYNPVKPAELLSRVFKRLRRR